MEGMKVDLATGQVECKTELSIVQSRQKLSLF